MFTFMMTIATLAMTKDGQPPALPKLREVQGQPPALAKMPAPLVHINGLPVPANAFADETPIRLREPRITKQEGPPQRPGDRSNGRTPGTSLLIGPPDPREAAPPPPVVGAPKNQERAVSEVAPGADRDAAAPGVYRKPTLCDDGQYWMHDKTGKPWSSSDAEWLAEWVRRVNAGEGMPPIYRGVP